MKLKHIFSATMFLSRAPTPVRGARGAFRRPDFAVVAVCMGLSAGFPAAALAQGDLQPAPAVTGGDICVEGRDLYRRGEHNAARTALLACLADEGDLKEILLPLTVIALQAGDAAQAVRFADRAVAAAPDDPEVLYWDGRALLAAGKATEARARWEGALQLDTGHLGVLEGLARLAVADRDPIRAYQFLMQMRQRGLNQPWLHRLLADIAAGRGLWAQALAHLQDALVLEPEQVADWMSASELALLGGDHVRSIAYSRKAVTLSPDAVSLGGLGEAFFAAEQVDSALVYLRRAVAAGGAKPRVRFNLANAMEVAGLTEEAGQNFKQFLKDEPKDPVGHFNYAIHLQKQGQLEEALAEANQALRLDPGMLTAGVVRVQILEDLGRWDDALAAVNDLKARDKSNQAELAAWQQRLTGRRDAARGEEAAGKIHLLHIVLTDRRQLAKVTDDLARGDDFATLAVRFSQGAAAVKGGDIGWIKADEMVEPLRGAIAPLQIGEVSPPIETKGLIHLFKRVR